MNGLKRQAPFKRQLLQISLLTVLNYSSAQACRYQHCIFSCSFSHKRIQINFKNVLECGAVGREKGFEKLNDLRPPKLPSLGSGGSSGQNSTPLIRQQQGEYLAGADARFQ